jgi:phosphate-selective porin OprO/OprP
LVGRLSYAPLLGASELIHLGAGVTLRKPSDDNSSNSSGPKFSTQRFRAKPESDVLAQRLVDTGEIRDVDHYSIEGLEAAGQRGAASLQGEIHFVQVERQHAPTLDFGGWYTQLAWTMTGEARPYKPGCGVFDGIRPRRIFASGGGWGAFEVAARISAIDLTSHELEGGKERNATLGLNWYLNPFLRTSANVVKVLSLKGGQLDGEKPTAFELRLQLGL